jgi:ATPase subunit of ABC transporter with duplicated ATPase domains
MRSTWSKGTKQYGSDKFAGGQPGFGGPLLLENINLQIERGESVGLLGRNGAGKSTLLKLLNGALSPDSGAVSRQQNLRTAYLSQEVPQGLSGRVDGLLPMDWTALPHQFEHHWQGTDPGGTNHLAHAARPIRRFEAYLRA